MTKTWRSDHRKIAVLKQEAAEMGLTPYASLYGDRRQRATWEKLLASADELVPLRRRSILDHAQINWKFAIVSFLGAVGFFILIAPALRGFLNPLPPIKITIQIGVK